MDGTTLFIIGMAVVFLIALIGMIGAIVITMKNRSQRLNTPIEEKEATIVRIGTSLAQQHVDITADNQPGVKTIRFRIGDLKKLEFIVPKKAYLELHEGTKGTLKFQGEQFISFTPLHEEAPVQEEENLEIPDTGITFWGTALEFQVDIPTDSPTAITPEEITAYIDKFTSCTEECFWGIECTRGVIQFSHEGDTPIVEIDIPAPEEKGSYQGTVSGASELKTIVNGFLQGKDIKSSCNFESW